MFNKNLLFSEKCHSDINIVSKKAEFAKYEARILTWASTSLL